MNKKVLVFFGIACTVLALYSCRTTREAATVSTLNGEWNIVEINGSAVLPTAAQGVPYIGFDAATGRIHGNSGCNRIMGNFDLNAAPGNINLGNLAGTRMACPDMTTEQNVMNALNLVRGYHKVGNRIALTGSAGRPVIILEKRQQPTNDIATINGEWRITEVNGQAIPTNMEKQPFILFDVQNKRVHGNAGCNTFNGTFNTDPQNIRAISFPPMAATMMACPDMTVERRVLDAVTTVKTYDIFNDGNLGFYNQAGTLVMVLAKR